MGTRSNLLWGLVLSAIYVIYSISPVSAAELYFEPVAGREGPGFIVRAMLRLERSVNALEGIIRFDPESVSVDRINAGVSGTPLWITEPVADDSGSIAFAGIFPGGLEPRITDRIALMEISFAGLAPGRTVLRYEDARVFLNTDRAVEDEVVAIPLTAILSEADIGHPGLAEDAVPPEPFIISVGFGAEPQAMYSVRDTGSGIARTELRERRFGVWGSWEPASNPHPLSGWWRWSIIEVRATDYAGNVRVGRYIPTALAALYAVIAAVAVFSSWASARWLRRPGTEH